MNELIQEVKNMITKENEKQRAYLKRNIIEEIQNNEKYNMRNMMEIYTNISALGIENGAKWNIGKIKKKEVLEKMNEEQRKELIDEIKSELKKYSFWEAKSYTHYFFKPHVKPEKKRVRLLVKGEKIDDYLFLAKEEEERIKEKLIELNIMCLEKKININDEKGDYKVVEIFLWLAQNPFLVEHSLNLIVREEKIDTLNEAEKIKEFIKNWFSIHRLEWMETCIKNVKMTEIDFFDSVYYVFTEHYQKELKKKYEEFFKEKIRDLKDRKSYYYEEELNDLLKEIETVNNW